MRKIRVITTYENVDDEFLEWYIEATIPSSHLFAKDFKAGAPITYVSKEPSGNTVATSTWQLIEEFEQ